MSRSQALLLRPQSFLSWTFVSLIEAPLFWLIRRFFSLSVYHKENLEGLKPPFILVSNHLALIDSWFAGYAIAFPKFLWKHWLLTWHMPEEKNYCRGFLAPFLWLNRTIPIIRGVAPIEQKVARDKVVSVLTNGEAIHIFPEGTRSRSGRIENYTAGIGRIYMGVPDCSILPIYIRGAEKILPIRTKSPRLFKNIDIVIVKPRKLTSPDHGIQGRVDISRQVFSILSVMGKEYFESSQYRSKEITR